MEQPVYLDLIDFNVQYCRCDLDWLDDTSNESEGNKLLKITELSRFN